jgi:mono/diheme cytochrome c family protein
MWKCRKKDGEKGRMGDTGKGRRGEGAIRPLYRRFSLSSHLPVTPSGLFPVFLLLLGLLATGCRRDMQDQPKMKPYRGTTFFADGLSGRQPIQGTVPRGFLREDTELFTGKKSATSATAATSAASSTSGPAVPAASPQSASAQASTANAFTDDTETFPFPITEDTVKRGRERYDIFCSVCHGLTGNGDGMIVRRGFRRAASFNDDRLRQAPVGHFFDAITNGWGAMPSYASQITVQDRWAIVAYVRALQLSQQNPNAQPGASPVPGASPGPISSPGVSPTPSSGGHD